VKLPAISLSFVLLATSLLLAQAKPIPPGVRQADQVEAQTDKNIPPPITQRAHLDLAKLRQGLLPLHRALTPTPEERLIREIVLQFKLGRISRAYFQRKFGVDILARFAEPLGKLAAWGVLIQDGDWLELSREGLLEVDRLVREFFLPKHRGARYA